MRVYRWVILKYGLYVLLAVLLFHLQSVPHFLAIAGIRPMPLIALAFAVAITEKELPGGLFGVFCGYLCDLFSYERMGFYMFFLFALCITAGLVARNYLRANWPVCALLTFTSMLLLRVVLLVFRFVLPRHPGGWHLFVTAELPMCFYTAVLAIPLFLLIQYLHKQAALHSETRF